MKQGKHFQAQKCGTRPVYNVLLAQISNRNNEQEKTDGGLFCRHLVISIHMVSLLVFIGTPKHTTKL